MKETLAWELRDNDYELLHHYRDKRADHTRHKIVVAISPEAYTDCGIDPDEVSEIVHKYIPDAVVYGSTGSSRMTFLWAEPLGTEPKAVGTDFYTKRRAASKTLRQHTLNP